jgi:glycosyltransferase involved in cell wall biosynthesis
MNVRAELLRGTQDKKISIVLHDVRGGGAERMMLRIAKGICDRGRNVDLVLVKAQGEFLRDIPRAARLIDLNSPSVATAIPSLVRYFRKEAPAAILTALTHMNVAVVMARWLAGSKARLVVSERNQISQKAAAVRGWRQKLVYSGVRFAYPFADAVTAVSRGVADDIVQFAGVKPQKIQVIYNPVFADEMVERSREPLDHPWFAEGEPPVILAVGRLHHQKGFDVLLNAFGAVLAEEPCRLIILGEGGERDRLERQAHELGIASHVQFPGFVKNPYAYMSHSALFVLSSRWEGLPGALIEAMACGCAVVATDCPSGPAEIIENGAQGAIVPVEDCHALAVAMKKMLNTPRGRGMDRARCFSTASAVDAYLEVLEPAR